MKLTLILTLALIFTACSTTYHQIFTVESENSTILGNKIMFEDSNIIVSYNLWSVGGEVEFSVYNKSNSDITLDLTKSYFVLNDLSYEYYQNRSYSSSSSNSSEFGKLEVVENKQQANTLSESSTKTVMLTISEKSQVNIPPKALKYFSEFKISQNIYRNCDLVLFNSRSRKINALNFSKTESPFIFSNILTYSNNGVVKRLQNNFYVAVIENYESESLFVKIEKDECGNLMELPKYIYKNPAPNRFYFKYK